MSEIRCDHVSPRGPKMFQYYIPRPKQEQPKWWQFWLWGTTYVDFYVEYRCEKCGVQMWPAWKEIEA